MHSASHCRLPWRSLGCQTRSVSSAAYPAPPAPQSKDRFKPTTPSMLFESKPAAPTPPTTTATAPAPNSAKFPAPSVLSRSRGRILASFDPSPTLRSAPVVSLKQPPPPPVSSTSRFDSAYYKGKPLSQSVSGANRFASGDAWLKKPRASIPEPTRTPLPPPPPAPPRPPPRPAVSKPEAKTVMVQDNMQLQDLAAAMGLKRNALRKWAIANGVEDVDDFTRISVDLAEMAVLEHKMLPHKLEPIVIQDATPRPPHPHPETLPLRSPVVTIMGHVDHGKTTLLDAFRNANVAAGEAGGITQKLGAFRVHIPGTSGAVTFLDTPGHAAFNSIRERGAQATDIVVLVVAADDGVMPTTIESIKYALQAKVPIVVAITKTDRPNANPKKVKEQLIAHQIFLEEFGGDVQAVEVCAPKRQNLDLLADTINTAAALADLRAEVDGPAEAIVIESHFDGNMGMSATALVRRGTLKIGAEIVCGTAAARVKTLRNELGAHITSAGPSFPVVITGWKTSPSVGDIILQVESAARAKEVCELREAKQRAMASEVSSDNSEMLPSVLSQFELRKNQKEQKAGTLEESPPATPNTPTVNVVVRADATGSVEAIRKSLLALSCAQVEVKVLAANIGAVTERDLTMARAFPGTFILAFNSEVPGSVVKSNVSPTVPILKYDIIYRLIDDIRTEMENLLPKVVEFVPVGKAEVLELFELKSKKIVIAGCVVREGTIKRKNTKFIVRRGDKVVHEAAVASLRNLKNDVNEVPKGTECGVALQDYSDMQVGDIFECVERQERRAKLDI